MSENLIAQVQSAGVVGARGAGLPTHHNLNAKAVQVIINGAECEPLLRVDQQLMDLQAEKLLTALDLIVDHVGAEKGVVALKEHYHAAAASLQRELPKHPKLSVHLLGAFYPAGDEQVIVYEVTGRIVPEGGIPLAVGVVVTNVETALNVLDASQGKPVVEKYVTLTGAVRTPKTVKVPLGITVAQALALAGGATVDHYKVVNGGPMMGKIVPVDSTITKTTKGLIVVPDGHPLLVSLERPITDSTRRAATACMQCSLCSEVCPRHMLGHRIEPHKLMRVAAYGSLCAPEQTPMNAYLCVGCRLCEYACVMGLQPWKLNNNMKNILAGQGIRNELHNQPEHAAPFRDYKRYPVHKLIHQLGLSSYDVSAPLDESVPAYDRVRLPLRQGAGAPSEPVVSVGAQVDKGGLIAQIPEGKLGSSLHASIAGTIAAIDGESIVIQA